MFLGVLFYISFSLGELSKRNSLSVSPISYLRRCNLFVNLSYLLRGLAFGRILNETNRHTAYKSQDYSMPIYKKLHDLISSDFGISEILFFVHQLRVIPYFYKVSLKNPLAFFHKYEYKRFHLLTLQLVVVSFLFLYLCPLYHTIPSFNYNTTHVKYQ